MDAGSIPTQASTKKHPMWGVFIFISLIPKIDKNALGVHPCLVSLNFLWLRRIYDSDNIEYDKAVAVLGVRTL